MRSAVVAGIMLLTASTGAARGDGFDAHDWSRRAEALVQSLLGKGGGAGEVIAPPADIDPKMVLTPPQGDRMPLIRPPRRPPQQ